MSSRPYTSWRAITRQYTAGRTKDTIWVLIHFLIKESSARFLPFYVAGAVSLLENNDPEWKWKLALLSGIQIGLLIWNVAGHTLYMRHLSTICRGFGHELRLRVCRQLQQLSLLFHGRQSTGKVHSKIIRDIDNIESIPTQVVQPVLSAFVTTAVTVTAVLISAPIVAPVFILVGILGFAINWFFKQRLNDTARAYRETTERLSSRLEDMLEMIPITRAHGLEEVEMESTERKVHDVRREASRFDIVSAMFGASSWSAITIFSSIFLAAMVVFAANEWISIAQVVLFQGLFGQVTFAMMMYLGVIPQTTRVRDSFSSVQEVLSAPDLEQDKQGDAVEAVTGRIELRDVSFTYPESDQPAIDNLSLTIEPNESVAIVGPSGGGKSTLLSLMLGMVRPTEGEIFLDDRDMQSLDMRSYRRHTAIVTQSSVFFSGTIRENVAYGSPDLSDDAIELAMRRANAWEFIEASPDRLDTRIGEGARSLSGGQMQRLALARALIRDPRVLVLDEPTSALDAENELLFREALRNMLPGRTTIMVSHALLNARIFPRIIVIADGKIEADGPHEQLLRSDNFYRRTYERLAI